MATIGRQAVVGVPPEVLADRAAMEAELTVAITETVTEAWGIELPIESNTWWVVSKPSEVDDVPPLDDCPNGYECSTCQEGRRLGKVYLARNPGMYLAIGLVSYRVPVTLLAVIPVDERTLGVLLPPDVDLDGQRPKGEG